LPLPHQIPPVQTPAIVLPVERSNSVVNARGERGSLVDTQAPWRDPALSLGISLR
jgi:hypothetical protein